MAEAIELEEGQIDSYMDEETVTPEKPTSEDWKSYLKNRYEYTKKEYKYLIMNQRELKGNGDAESLSKLRIAFSENYKSRKYIVKQLRAIGETVEDPFIVA